MQNEISEKKIKEIITKIRHSAIDCTLVELGIIKDFTIDHNKVSITLAFPFENIPIKDYVIMSIKVPLEKMGVQVNIQDTVMNEKETERFLKMETKYWKGSVNKKTTES